MYTYELSIKTEQDVPATTTVASFINGLVQWRPDTRVIETEPREGYIRLVIGAAAPIDLDTAPDSVTEATANTVDPELSPKARLARIKGLDHVITCEFTGAITEKLAFDPEQDSHIVATANTTVPELFDPTYTCSCGTTPLDYQTAELHAENPEVPLPELETMR